MRKAHFSKDVLPVPFANINVWWNQHDWRGGWVTDCWAQCRGFNPRMKQIFIWPSGSCCGSGCLRMWLLFVCKCNHDTEIILSMWQWLIQEICLKKFEDMWYIPTCIPTHRDLYLSTLCDAKRLKIKTFLSFRSTYLSYWKSFETASQWMFHTAAVYIWLSRAAKIIATSAVCREVHSAPPPPDRGEMILNLSDGMM